MTATDTSPVSVASYFVNMYFSECLLLRHYKDLCSLQKLKTADLAEGRLNNN